MLSMLPGRGWPGEAGSNHGSGMGSVGQRVVSGCIVCVLAFFPFPFYYIIIIIILIIKLFLSQPTSFFPFAFGLLILSPIPQGWGE